jgi:hypothetical protein
LSRGERAPAGPSPAAVLDQIGPGADLIVPLANGEPVTLLDAIEAEAMRLVAKQGDWVEVH